VIEFADAADGSGDEPIGILLTVHRRR
jgi:hypothetical protein